MKRKGNVAITFVIILVVLLGFSIVIYRYFYADKQDIYQTYLAVYQQLDQDIDSIHINSINHNVEFSLSSDDKIRIDYYQKLDNANSYRIDGKDVYLTMAEQVEDIDSIFFSKTDEIRKIKISLPADKQIYIELTSIDGDLTINSIDCRTVRYTTITGKCIVNNCFVDSFIANNNSGDIELNNFSTNLLNIKNTSGDCIINLVDLPEEYKLDLSTTYGVLKINDQLVYQEDLNKTLVVVNKYVDVESKEKGSLTVESTRGAISVNQIK